MTATAPQLVSPPLPSVAPAARPRVLIADDSRVIRQAIRKVLESEFDVELVESGDKAWELLARDQNFQMLVTDIEMPGMDGYELICRIRGSDGSPIKELPILTITGAEDEQTKERAFACGATDFITKPIDTIQLKARVQSYVRLEQSARDLAEKANQLEEQAIADPVTGLRSRKYFLQRGEQDVAYCVRNRKDVTVIRFDIDHYKELYRKHGDDVGDHMLSWLAALVSASARVEDTVARVAGAKFAILATATDMEAAKSLCQRIRKGANAKPFTYQNVVIKITLSFGLASLVQDGAQKIETLLQLADERAMRAITEGGNRVCVSVLGESTPNIEELVLDMPAVTDDVPATPAAAVAPPPVVSTPMASPAVSAVEPAAVPMAQEVGEPASLFALDPVLQLISIDKALQLIASGEEKLLAPYLKVLKEQLRPLLDLITHNEKNVR